MSAFEIGNRHIGVEISAQLGGRIIQLTDRLAGETWLMDRARIGAPVDAAYADGDRSGWDECFPSITPILRADGESSVPDHGYLWSRAWDIVARGERDCVLRSPRIPGLPLELTKTVTVASDSPRLTSEYRLMNQGRRAVPYLYSGHPLWVVSSNGTLTFESASTYRVEFGSSLATGSSAQWPILPTHRGQSLDLSALAHPGAGHLAKVFVETKGMSECVLAFDDRSRSLRYEFDEKSLPWLGVCINEGVWPSPSAEERWIALEPTTSPADSAVIAETNGLAPIIEPDTTHEWSVVIELMDVKEDL